MILVTLGTQDKSFIRLLETIDDLIEKGVINEKVVVQAGFTKYNTKNMEIFNLIPKDEFDDLIKNCRYVISHGGVGTILTALNNGKKVIGVPRLKKYKEHVNDHQVQLIEHFSKAGYIIGIEKLDNLSAEIKKIDNYTEFNIGHIGEIIKYLLLRDINKIVMLGKVEKKLIFESG